MRRIDWRAVVVAVAALGAVVSWVGLGAAQRGDPIHYPASFGEGIPATIYMPEEDPPSPVPVAVLAHGYSGDRVGLSTLARWFAKNGYAAVAFDFRGHGTNDRAFVGNIRDDLTTVLDGVDDGGDLDPQRIALVGHSMGAGAVVEHASRDRRVAATVALAGGWSADGPLRPANVLFLVPSNSDEDHREGRDLAGEIADERVPDGETRGSFVDDTAVGVDTVTSSIGTIITSPGAAERSIQWLDRALGVDRSGDIDLGQDRRGWLLLYLPCLVVLLYATGVAVGRLAPGRDSGEAKPQALAVLLVALLAPWPVVGLTTPTAFLPVDVADGLVGELALAGGVLLAAIALARAAPGGSLAHALGDPESGRLWHRRTVLAGLAGVGAVYLLLLPIGPFVHELVPTPKRLLIGAAVAAGLLVFFLPLELLLRRGSPLAASATSIAARIVVLATLQVGATLGLVPGFLLLLMPVLVIVLLLLEIVAAGVYRVSRNRAVIGATSAGVTGWLLGALMPLRF